MADISPPRAGSLGFFGLLALLFIALKLTGTIDWAWGWVLAPLWMPFALVLGLVLLTLVLSFIAALLKKGGR